jgi:hypothetical protein
MVIFGKNDLNWVRFKDLPLNSSFITRSADQIFYKKNEKVYVREGKVICPAENVTCFAEVKVVLCAAAVRKEDDTSMDSALTRHPTPCGK